jgi:thymidylate synthase ThyX
MRSADAIGLDAVQEEFTDEERARLTPHFTNLAGPVFALVNLPEVVKGALFARYSRSAKSLRRLFLDEFSSQEAPGTGTGQAAQQAATSRADSLYERVFFEYGDDSVAQLGGVHLAVEQASQPLAKVLEWGRLAAYLEQSTRYVPYDDRPGGRWRYVVPAEVAAVPELAARYRHTLDATFEAYARWLGPMQDLLRDLVPKDPADSEFVHRMTIRAKACDALRGLLPAATRTNVGIFATAQSYEQLLLRMRVHPLAEVRASGALILEELRKVIPAFLTRVDVPDRGVAWSEYLESTRRSVARVASKALAGVEPEAREEVALTDFDPDGEVKVVAAALYSASRLPDDQLVEVARKLTPGERARILTAYVGERRNRRHKPGRAFERTSYRFDVLCDYGAFRDLQRHRTLTVEWQPLSIAHGYEVPPEIDQAGARRDFETTMSSSAALHEELRTAGLEAAAQYAVSMAYRIRFYMDMNAREAMHLIELRTTPQGHPAYRRVCQRMHRLIAERAGHRAIAGAMRFVDHSGGDQGRLEAERRNESRRRIGQG